MAINLSVPREAMEPLEIELLAGHSLFVLGANGSGKSSLMHRFNSNRVAPTRWISAHRQTWFESGIVNITPYNKDTLERQFQDQEQSLDARWRDFRGGRQTQIALHNLMQQINAQSREVVKQLRNRNRATANRLASEDEDPIAIINRLLTGANLQVTMEEPDLHKEEFLARKLGSEPYSVAELSDGERNAIVIAAEVLTAEPGTLMLIDEPERHLHRSIISPLLTTLFLRRSDCVFVVSTHEVMLPIDSGASKVLLLRGCTYRNRAVASWDANLVPSSDEIDESIRKDILGARRAVLFVEGEDASLDKRLYNLVFPDVSVTAKQDCKSVENAVRSLRSLESLHRVQAYGIVDGDGKTKEEKLKLKSQGVFALDVYSVESIYYGSKIREAVARRQANVTGANAADRLESAIDSALSLKEQSAENLCKLMAEYAVRRRVQSEVPNRNNGMFDGEINIRIDTEAILNLERDTLKDMIAARNLDAIIARYPIKHSAIPGIIADKLGFATHREYEEAVLKLLQDRPSMLKGVRAMFGDLYNQLSSH